MTALAPRLRMFAGPNGSGKSTLKDILPPQWLGVYVNADDIEKTIRTHADLNLTDFAVTAQEAELRSFPVAEDKIRSRYARSLSLLSDALAYTDRAYVFDNSGHSRVWVAEATGGVELEAKSSEIPAWFRTALWDNFEQGTP